MLNKITEILKELNEKNIVCVSYEFEEEIQSVIQMLEGLKMDLRISKSPVIDEIWVEIME